jgi:pre-mRNA-processing factor 19
LLTNSSDEVGFVLVNLLSVVVSGTSTQSFIMAAETLKLDFVTLDVFTDQRFLGNPLAVVLVPASVRSRLTQEIKQRIAREFNLSETVFLHTLENEPDRGVTVREIDIFTIESELPFAGHPTIGSAFLVLHHFGWTHIDTLQTKSGPIRIGTQQIHGKPGVRAAIPHAVHVHQRTLLDLLDAPSTSQETAAQIHQGLSPDPEIRVKELEAPVVSIVRGMAFVLVQLPSLEHLGKVTEAKRLDFSKIPELLDEGEWHESFVSRYYYVPTGEDAESGGAKAVRARMVELGFEDPATGSAACTLASYLALKGEGTQLAITQGVEMGRKSNISVAVTLKDGGKAVEEVHLGGSAVVVMNGSITV